MSKNILKINAFKNILLLSYISNIGSLCGIINKLNLGDRFNTEQDKLLMSKTHRAK